MKIDCNAYIGEWPFRELRHNTADGLLKLMDRHRIDKACVTHLSGLFYKNAHNANRRLHREIRKHRSRLIPFCVINPSYPGWEDDLAESLEVIGAGAVALYPSLHNYSLHDACAKALMARCGEKDIPVVLSERIEDERQEHWLFKVPNVPFEDIVKTVNDNRKIKFLIHDAAIMRYAKAVRGANCWFDVSRMDITVSHAHRDWIVKHAGRLLFGTQMPLKTPLPAILKIDHSDLRQSVQKYIFSKNIIRLLS